jgi:hypothetical protein
MNEYLKTLIYVIVGAAFLSLAWVARPAAPGRTVVRDTGEPFFKDFKDPLEAASLEIISFDEATGTPQAFKVARHAGVWSIPSHENYAADAENRFAGAAAALLDLAKGITVSDLPADHELYGVVDPAEADPGAVGVDKEKFSTRFEDWIEKDLLQLSSSDITGVIVRDYSVDEMGGRLIQGDGLRLSFDDTAFEWSLEGLGEGEELETTKLDEMRRALDQLEIVDVHRKPAGLSSELRAEDALQLTAEAVNSLRSRGFYIHQGRLLSNQGETIVQTANGVQYTLRFGEIVVTQGGGDEAEEGDGTGRYLFVTAELDPNGIPQPDLTELPDMSHLIDQQVAEDGEDDSARPAVEEAIEQARARVEQENQQKQQEYEQKLDQGRQRARELNERFADWYYVIADDVYEKVRLRREDVVKPIEPE